MSLAENLLDTLPDTATANELEQEERHIVIDAQRKITVPNELKLLAVKGDKNVETVTIDCVRYWDEHDLSDFLIYLYYITPRGEERVYNAENIVVGDNIFSFDWTIGREITLVSGKLTFWLVAKKFNDNNTLLYQWSSLQNSECTVANGGDISNNVEEPSGEYEGFFDGSSSELTLKHITKIRADAFRDDTFLTKINIPNVVTIEHHSFSGCTSLQEVAMPKITTINLSAFYECESLNIDTIPKSVSTIGGFAFFGCTSLVQITFKGKPSEIGWSAFDGCTNLKVINVPWAQGEIPDAPWGASSATINYNYGG